jgi:hypothetical protein
VPVVLHARGRVVDTGAFAVGVLLLAVVAMWAQTLVARRTGLTIHNECWGPGVAFGMATGGGRAMGAATSGPDGR